MSDALAAFNVLEVQVTAGLPGPPGSKGSDGRDGSPDTPYLAVGSSIARNSIARASDAISIKDDAVGDGVAESSDIAAFFTRLAAGYTSAVSIPETARAGYVPGGIFDADTQTFSSPGRGWTLYGDGPVSQLENTTLQVDDNFCNIRDLALIGAGAYGVDVRGSNNNFLNLSINGKDVGYNNDYYSFGETSGAFVNAVIGGVIANCNIGARIGANDALLLGTNIAGTGTVGEYISHAGGIRTVACRLFPNNGPGLVLEGNIRSFTGDTTIDGTTISDISIDTALLTLNEIITGTGIQSGTIITGAPTSSSVTISKPATATGNDVALTQSHIPIECYHLGNMYDNSGTRDYNIVSIVSAAAGASILVTVDEDHTLSMGVEVTINGTGNTAYDGKTGYVQAIPSDDSFQLSFTYDADVGAVGTTSAPDFTWRIRAGGTSAAARGHWFTHGNTDCMDFDGGSNLTFVNMRAKVQIFFRDNPNPNNVLFFRGGDEGYAGGTSGTPAASSVVRNTDIPVSGHGSLLGWGIIGLHRTGIAGYDALQGSFYVGAQVPYTDGGLLNRQPAELNYYGIMNHGFRLRSNARQYDVWGEDWLLSNSTMRLREGGTINAAGTTANPAGTDLDFILSAYRSNNGLVYGNVIQRFTSARSDTAAGATATGGFAVIPGNSASTVSQLFFGSVNTEPTLTGDAASIQALTGNVMEINTQGNVSLWRDGSEYFRMSGNTSGAGDSRLVIAQNAATRFLVQNSDGGAAAEAVLSVRNEASAAASLQMRALGTAFTPAGDLNSDMGVLDAGANLSNGLLIRTQAGNLVITAAGDVIVSGLPTSDPSVTGALWVDTGAANVLKVSA